MIKQKVAFLISHPIQYIAPLFAKIASHPQIDFTVLYCSDESIRGMKDAGFGRRIVWDIDLLKGYKYKFLKNYSTSPTIFKPPFGLINIGIIRDIFQSRYDAVIIYGWHYATYWLAYAAALLKGTPIFIRSDPPLNQELLKPKWKILLKKIILGFLFSRAKAFFACGTENRLFYEFYGAEKKDIFIIPHAVDNERFIKSSNELTMSKAAVRREIGVSLEKTIILFCGKLIKKKRPMDLLDAYKKLNLENKALVFIGDGHLRKELEEAAGRDGLKEAYFLGFKNQTEISKYYAAADIFVLTSGIGETWGLVVNEAMCFKLPIVISDLPGCGKDLVKHGENGFIFKTGNTEELAGYLKRLIEDPVLRKRMGDNSYKTVKSWDYNSYISKMVSALQE